AKVAPFFERGEDYAYNTNAFLQYLNNIKSFRLNSRSSPLYSNPPASPLRSSPNTLIIGRYVDSICLRYSVPGYYSNKYSLRPACRPPKSSIYFVNTIEDSDIDLELAGKPARDLVCVTRIRYYCNASSLIPPSSSL
ncbi:hypothetical protein L249_4267, partial [Ophiocordyceps polyrhachis-furcata BCC 54312]